MILMATYAALIVLPPNRTRRVACACLLGKEGLIVCFPRACRFVRKTAFSTHKWEFLFFPFFFFFALKQDMVFTFVV